ncbi:hypothetical protein [Alkalicoccobacillus plakortidis]|uniref:Uncharacterized protein n=1 Tax=Alkalicoccobacillus plakortidis TaxID=444060 RepID=A0ABT0XHM8_9BACI|nr:hypothetical protein [Alkalicoccobacillus plakortidis]MCM2675426.1 hypothetical protein [Alkalicoccobacillus plakortidis]
MSVTSSKLLDGFIAGLLTAFLLTMKDLMMYQSVNWTLTLIIASAVLLLFSIVLPFLRRRPQTHRRRVVG